MTEEEIKAFQIQVGKTFIWHECNVPDAEVAKDFYSHVFGWTTEGMDMGEMGTYTLFKNNNIAVGGIMATVGDMAHVPPHWSTYIACDDVDAACARVESKGGAVMVPAFDVPTVGRMSLCKDSQGAVFWVFKSSSA